jgi:hypothetical protein
MVEIPTPKPYIYMIKVNGQIKCPKSWGPGSSPSPTGIFFENYTYLWNHFVNFNQSYVRYVWGPIHHTCMTCLFFSFLLIYKTRPNDFDLQLGCCISDAFSIFNYYILYFYIYIYIYIFSF